MQCVTYVVEYIYMYHIFFRYTKCKQLITVIIANNYWISNFTFSFEETQILDTGTELWNGQGWNMERILNKDFKLYF